MAILWTWSWEWSQDSTFFPEIIAVSGDVGQGTELDGLEEKALKTGASKLYILDLTDEYVNNYIIPTMKAGTPPSPTQL